MEKPGFELIINFIKDIPLCFLSKEQGRRKFHKGIMFLKEKTERSKKFRVLDFFIFYTVLLFLQYFISHGHGISRVGNTS